MTGRVAIVTGGTGALGQSIVLRFLLEGASVAVPWVVAEEWATLESRAGDARPRLHGLRADVTDEAAMAAFLSDVLGRFPRVDVLVNAVGGFAGGDLASTPLPERTARRGRIVNISSRAVVPPLGGFIAYTVAKSAIIALTQALAQEVRGHGITVNAVLPSTMDTPANRRDMPDADRSGWVSTDAVADVIAYLVSDGAVAVSGACIPV